MMTIDEATRALCDVEGVGIKDIVSSSRLLNLCRCRLLIWCTLRTMGYSTQKIGAYFARDHSTIARLTKLAPQRIKDEAAELVETFGLQPLEWLEPFCKGNNGERRPLRSLPKPKPLKKHKKVPDYKNYCVKIVLNE